MSKKVLAVIVVNLIKTLILQSIKTYKRVRLMHAESKRILIYKIVNGAVRTARKALDRKRKDN